MPGTKNVHKQLGKGNSYREISSKFGVVASTGCEKVNTTGTDESLFRLVPMPGHGAQISARTPKKGYIQTGTHARPPGTGTNLNRALVICFVLIVIAISLYYTSQ